ncbi:MAG: hypothetical protein QOG19_2725 [Mycobacterium sp.]|nr:hypothetical protein [Mycobacterium sp.]
MTEAERRAVISGIGQSQVGRRLGRDALDLTIDAALQAIADARLTVAEIDGLATYPGGVSGFAGFSGPGSPEVHDALRLSLSWHGGGAEGPGQLQAVINAVMAVSMGLARHVLVYRTVTESTAQGTGRRSGIGVGSGQIDGPQQWLIPFRAYSAANWLALYAATLSRVRNNTRADGADRAECPSQCCPQPGGGVSHTVDPRRLSELEDGVLAVSPI